MYDRFDKKKQKLKHLILNKNNTLFSKQYENDDL